MGLPSFFTLFIGIAVFFIFYPLTRRSQNLRWGYICLFSLFLYSLVSLPAAVLLVFSSLVVFITAIRLETAVRWRKLMFFLTLGWLLFPLLSIKYSAFMVNSLDYLLAQAQIPLSLQGIKPNFSWIASAGLSFYTLQAIGYLLDVYQKRLKPAQNFLHFLAFQALFPKLLSGPIERGRSLLEQLREPATVGEAERWQGLKWLSAGLFLKVAISDHLAPYLAAAFEGDFVPSSLHWWLNSAGYAFQVYFDFASYSLIAVGLGIWMGINLTQNFNHPYLAASFAEFWQRWHISLSNWLRDYIFFPLERSGRLKGRHHLNNLITFLVSGLWHGAGWTYVIWGVLHALFISLERWLRWPQRLKAIKGGRSLAVVLVFLQATIAWVFFRANSVHQGVQILSNMFSFNRVLPENMAGLANLWIYILLGLAVLFYVQPVGRFRLQGLTNRIGDQFAVGLLLAGAVFLQAPVVDFVYALF